jgi:hypothetical protein
MESELQNEHRDRFHAALQGYLAGSLQDSRLVLPWVLELAFGSKALGAGSAEPFVCAAIVGHRER